MTSTTTVTLNVTPEELEIIRTALCQHSMKQLMHAHGIQQECEEKGIPDDISHIWMNHREKIRSIIHAIDEMNA